MRSHGDLHRIMANGFADELIKVGDVGDMVKNLGKTFTGGSSGPSMSAALDPKKVSGAAGMANRAMGRAGFGDSPSARPSELQKEKRDPSGPVSMGDPLSAPKLQAPTATSASGKPAINKQPDWTITGNAPSKPAGAQASAGKPPAKPPVTPAGEKKPGGDTFGPPAPGPGLARSTVGVQGVRQTSKTMVESMKPRPTGASAEGLSAALGKGSSPTTATSGGKSSPTTAPKASRGNQLDLSSPGELARPGDRSNAAAPRPA